MKQMVFAVFAFACLSLSHALYAAGPQNSCQFEKIAFHRGAGGQAGFRFRQNDRLVMKAGITCHQKTQDLHVSVMHQATGGGSLTQLAAVKVREMSARKTSYVNVGFVAKAGGNYVVQLSGPRGALLAKWVAKTRPTEWSVIILRSH